MASLASTPVEYHGIREKCDDRGFAVKKLVKGLLRYVAWEFFVNPRKSTFDLRGYGWELFNENLHDTLIDWMDADSLSGDNFFSHLFPEENNMVDEIVEMVREKCERNSHFISLYES
jgi:hypothetical protein